MRSLLWVVCTFVMSATFALQVYGAPGESIVLDPNTGDYQITYLGTGSPGNKKNKPLRKTIFVPSTKITPTIVSSYKLRGADTVVYSYRVRNGSTSRQPLVSIIFDPITDIVSAVPLPKRNEDVDINTIAQIDRVGRDSLATPRGWYGSAVTSDDVGLRIGWMIDSLNKPNAGLTAGSTQEGFGFTSMDIPGIGVAEFRGRAPILSFVDEGPTGEIANQLEKLTQNDFVPRNAAVPSIAVPEPFDPAVTLERIQTHMHTWIGMSLLDSAFSAQLDRSFQSAISAYRLNQPKVGKKQIQTMREMLKKEHADADREDDNDERREKGDHDDKNKPILIDKLAARILDFDLKYVTKRMGGDKDD
jgi:hypothetical protein